MSARVLTQSMIDACLKIDSKSIPPENAEELAVVLPQTQFLLEDTAVGVGSEYKSYGTRLEIRPSSFQSALKDKSPQDWITETGYTPLLVEVIILSATVSTFLKTTGNGVAGKRETVLVPKELTVVLEDEKVIKECHVSAPTSNKNSNPRSVITDKTTALRVLQLDASLRSKGMSRSQAEDEGMLFQIQFEDVFTEWNEKDLFGVISFLLPPSRLLQTVDIDVGMRLVRVKDKTPTE